MAATEVVARFTADISDVQSKMRLASGAFSAVGEAAAFSSKRIAAVGQSMADAGAKMTVGLTLPLGGLAVASANAAMSFETNMSKITGLVGIAADEVARMGDEVLGIAGAVGKSPDELAEGLFVVTSAGLRGAEAMATLSNSAKAGAAGLGETNDIARAVAGALSAYGSEVLSASAATDAIVATARAGNFETSQFAAAIGRVLPFAKQAGASFQDMGGAVALLTRVNGNAAESITQMQALFRAFVAPTGEARDALDEVGLSAQQLRESMAEEGLPATLAMLDKALGGNREQLFKVLGSSEAASAAFQILDANAQTVKDTFGVVANSAGMTAEAFGVVSGTASFQVSQAMAELKATLIDLGEQFLPIIKSIADFVTANLRAFSSLPGPIKTTITVMAGFLAVLGPILFVVGKLIVVFSTLLSLMLKTRAVTAMRAAFLGLRGEMAAARVSMQQTRGTMASMGVAAKAASLAVKTSFLAIGAAAKGLLASLGPIGIAMLAVGAALEIFIGKAAGSQHHLENLRDEIDLTTGKMTEAARIFIASELRHNISDEDIAMMESYGISVAGFIAALEQGGPALDGYREKITAMGEAQSKTGGVLGKGFLNVGTVNSINTIVETLDGMVGYYDEAKTAAQDAAQSQVDSAMAASDAARGQSSTYRALAQEKRAADASMTASQKSLDAALNAGVRAVEGLEEAFAAMNKAIANEASRDTAIRGIKDLNTSLKENGGVIKKNSDEALANRQAVRQAAQGWIDYAASAKDPEQAQKRLAEGQDEIRASLKKAGIKPGQSDIFKVFKAQQTESKKTVDEFAQQREIASRYGNEVGMNFIDGIISELERRRDEVAAAAAAATSGLTTGGNAGIDATSPSRDAMKVAGNFVDGVVVGLTRSTPKVNAAARELAMSLTRAFNQALAPSMGEAQSAFAEAFANIPPLAIAERMLQDASWALADARDGVADAEKALAEARKDGNAREVAAAERDLARAKRDVTDATKGLSAAQKSLKMAEYVAENRKAIEALQDLGKAYDRIMAKMEESSAALTALQNLAAKPLGTESDISRQFQFGIDPSSLARNYVALEATIRQAYAALLDPKIVGAAAARRNKALMDSTLAQLETFTRQMIAKQEEYNANVEQLRKNEEQFRIDERALSENLATATRAYDEANTELKRIVGERNSLTDGIEKGFTSFVNSLSGLTDGIASQVRQETQELANGVKFIVQSTRNATESGAAGIAATLRSRLDEVRAFSANVQSLMERGLDPSLVRSFIEAGVSGAGATVASLASATDDELRGINDTQAELLRHAQEFATGVGDAYFGAAITAQQGIVDQTKAAVDAAQKALTDARTAYDTERARLEAENTRLESEINALGAQIEAIIAHLAATLPPQTLAAGQAAVQSLIDGFNQKFPGMRREFGRLMDALAKSMERTTTITVRTVHEGAAVRASATTSTRSAVGGAPTVTPGTVPVFTPRSGRMVTIAPNAVSVNVNAGTSVDRAALTAQVRAAVDDGLQELAREIIAV